MLTPGSNLNINLSAQSPGSVGYPGSGYGPGTGASTPVTPGELIVIVRGGGDHRGRGGGGVLLPGARML